MVCGVADTAHELAQVLWLGGSINTEDALAPKLPQLISMLTTWLPNDVRTQTRGMVFSDGRSATKATIATPKLDDVLDNILHYLSSSWVAPLVHSPDMSDAAVHAWRLVDEYTQNTRQNLRALFDEFAYLTSHWTNARALERYLMSECHMSQADIDRITTTAPAPLFGVEDKASHLFARVLHYWGRGFLDHIDSTDLPDKLARILALRTIVDHLLYLEVPEQIGNPRRYLERLAYESILTTQQVHTMQTRLSNLIPAASSRAGVHERPGR